MNVINLLIRCFLGGALITTIWIRVDWSVGLFALLVFIRSEIDNWINFKR
jgi:hypothetical protein